jgi:ABC-2 type transport system permease protein
VSAVGLVAQRELTELWRDGRLLLAGGLMALLLLTAWFVGSQRQAEIEGERAAAQTLDYDAWVAQERRHPHDAAHQGMHVFKPLPATAVLDPGITPYVGSTIWLQAHRQSELRFRPAQDATGLQRFGNLSVAWVLQVLGPLVVIVLGFNAFAGEREQGTLRQALSLGVPPRRLLWGKALALAVALAACLLPLLALGMAVLGAQGDAEAVVRAGLLALGYALYLGIAVLVVLAVSALVPSTRLALTLLLALWIAGVTLAPRAASDLARDLHPSPSRQAFNQGIDTDLDQAYKRAWREQLGTDKRWGAELPLNRWGLALRIDDEAGYEVSDQHFGQLWDSYASQQRAQEWAGLVVPLLALRGWSMGLAGTDFAAHRHFAVAAEQQRREMQDLISHHLVEHADPLGNQHFTYQAGKELWTQVQRFDYQAIGVGEAARHNAPSLLVLLMGLVAAAGLAAWAVGVRKP